MILWLRHSDIDAARQWYCGFAADLQPPAAAVKRGLFFTQPAVVFNIFNRVFNIQNAVAPRFEKVSLHFRFLTFSFTVENYFSHFQPDNKIYRFAPLSRWKIAENVFSAQKPVRPRFTEINGKVFHIFSPTDCYCIILFIIILIIIGISFYAYGRF